MTSRTLTIIVAAVLGGALLCVGGLIALAGGAAACTPRVDASALTSPGLPAQAPVPVPGYDDEQLTNAAIIVAVGTGRGIPVSGLVIAVAAALQESSLRNLGDLGPNNDHD